MSQFDSRIRDLEEKAGSNFGGEINLNVRQYFKYFIAWIVVFLLLSIIKPGFVLRKEDTDANDTSKDENENEEENPKKVKVDIIKLIKWSLIITVIICVLWLLYKRAKEGGGKRKP